MADMSKRERVMAAVKGEPVDRIPVSFFGHRKPMERFSSITTAHLLEQNRRFDWDFVKIMLRASYYGEAWGSEYRWDSQEEPMLENPVIKEAEDFRKLENLDPTQGVFADLCKIPKTLNEALKGNVPIVHTIYSPLVVADYLYGNRGSIVTATTKVKQIMKENPEALHHGLSIISQTLAEYARQVIRAGADGIMMSTTAWSGDVISEEDYKTFGKAYDVPIFEAAVQEGATFNIMHICRGNIMLDLFSDYPIHVINYDALYRRNPSLKEAMSRTDKALWGGLNQTSTLVYGPVAAIEAEVREAIEQTGGKRFLLGAGCEVTPNVPDKHLVAAKEALSSWQEG